MRMVDIMLAIPGFLMAIGIAALFGGGGLVPVMIAIGVVNIPIFARMTARLDHRPARRRLRARGALGRGARTPRAVGAHPPERRSRRSSSQGTLALATAIIDAAGLGFLGLGPQDPATPEWGPMLTGATRYLQTAPFLAIFPGLAIIVAALGFNLVGDSLREALDPKLRGRV